MRVDGRPSASTVASDIAFGFGRSACSASPIQTRICSIGSAGGCSKSIRENLRFGGGKRPVRGAPSKSRGGLGTIRRSRCRVRAMHETRNFIMVLLAIGSFLWGVVAWFVLDSETAPVIWFQRATSALLFVSMAVWLVYAFQIEDKLPDHMAGVVGPMCYGADGLDFMPTVRRQGEQAELCVYYQNRYENPAEVIVHLRPPEDSFIIKPGVRDVHFAFKAGGGDFGMITQPIAVPEHLQGEVIEVQLGAMSFYRRSQAPAFESEAASPAAPCSSTGADPRSRAASTRSPGRSSCTTRPRSISRCPRASPPTPPAMRRGASSASRWGRGRRLGARIEPRTNDEQRTDWRRTMATTTTARRRRTCFTP